MTTREQFPIGPDSPESAQLDELVSMLNALVEGMSARAKGSAGKVLTDILAVTTSLPSPLKRQIYSLYHKVLGRSDFQMSDLVKEAFLNELLALGAKPDATGGNEEGLRRWIGCNRGFVEALLRAGTDSPEAKLKAGAEALVASSTLLHPRVREYFKKLWSTGSPRTRDHSEVKEGLKVYWQECEDEIARLGMAAESFWSAKRSEAKEASVSDSASVTAEGQPVRVASAQETGAPRAEGVVQKDKPEDEVQELLGKGKDATSVGDYVEALRCFKGAWKVSRDSVYMKSRMREFYDLLLLAEGGMELLSAEAERDPYDSVVQTVLSKYYFKIGKNEDGVRHAKKEFALNPNAKPEIAVEALTKGLGLSDKERAKRGEAKRGKLEHLFEGVPGIDEGSAPSDVSKTSSIPGRVMSGARDLADHLMARFKKAPDPVEEPIPPEPNEEPITPEMAEAAVEAIPENPKEEARFKAINEKDLERWFVQGEVKPGLVSAKAEDLDFAKGKVALEGGKTDEACKWFAKLLKGNPDNGTLRHTVLNVFREHGLTEWGETIVSEGMDQDSGGGLVALGNFFCECGTLRDLALAWNYYSHAMRIDTSLFQKQDLDALGEQMRVKAEGGEVTLTLNISKGGSVYALPPLRKSAQAISPEAKPRITKEAIFALLEERGLLLDKESQSVEDVMTWLVERGDIDLVRMVVGAGADPNGVDKSGNTPLFKAAAGGSAELVDTLLALGADPNKTAQDGWTPLIIAIHCDSVEVINALIEGRADVNKGGSLGRTALIFSAAEGKANIVELLLAHGATVDLPDENGNTALMEAAKWGHLETVKLLLAHGATVDLPDENGNTALMRAVKKGHLEIVMLLQTKGASVSLKNKEGVSAWDFEQIREKAAAELAKSKLEISEAFEVPKIKAQKVDRIMERHSATRKSIAGERGNPPSTVPASGDSQVSVEAAPVPKPAETRPDKETRGELRDLYAIFAMWHVEIKTMEGRLKLAEAVQKYKNLIGRLPKANLDYGILIPILRELWLEGIEKGIKIVSREFLDWVHERDLNANPNDYKAISNMGKTFLAEETDEGRVAAEHFFEKAFKLEPNPRGDEYKDIPQLLEEVSARNKEVSARKLEMKKAEQKKALQDVERESPSEMKTAPGISLVEPITQDVQQKPSGLYRMPSGVKSLMEVEDPSKDKAKGGK